MSHCVKKKSLTAKSNIINTKKWFSTSNKDCIYTYLEYKTTNRIVKDEIVNEMKQWNLNTFVFTKPITSRNSGAVIKTYIIGAPYKEFSEVYSHVITKETDANFALS